LFAHKPLGLGMGAAVDPESERDQIRIIKAAHDTQLIAFIFWFEIGDLEFNCPPGQGRRDPALPGSSADSSLAANPADRCGSIVPNIVQHFFFLISNSGQHMQWKNLTMIFTGKLTRDRDKVVL
jgi:hypothetical protein